MKKTKMTYDIMYKLLLEEMYGITYDELKELSDLCAKVSSNWYSLFYMEENTIESWFETSKYNKDRYAKALWAEPFGIKFNHAPTSNKEVNQRTFGELDTSPDKDRILEIVNKSPIRGNK